LPLNAANLQKIREKKPEKPAWALTEKQAQDKKEIEEEELVSFMQELDFDKYLQDLEVKLLMNNLRERISRIENDEEEKQRLEEQIKKDNQFKVKTKTKAKPFFEEPSLQSPSKPSKKAEREEEMEKESVASQAPSHAGSVASSKTQETIQSLKERMNQEKDWDKSVQVSIEQKIIGEPGGEQESPDI
jgi:hypothetical protein